MYHLTDFKDFVWKKFLIFNPIDPVFIDFRSVWTPHFRKTLDPIGSSFFSHAEPGYLKICEVPSPPQIEGEVLSSKSQIMWESRKLTKLKEVVHSLFREVIVYRQGGLQISGGLSQNRGLTRSIRSQLLFGELKGLTTKSYLTHQRSSDHKIQPFSILQFSF